MDLNRGKDLRELYVRYIDVADLQGVQVGVVDTQTLESSREYSRLKGSNESTVDVRHEEIVTIFHHGNQALNVLVPNAQDREALVSTSLAACRDVSKGHSVTSVLKHDCCDTFGMI